MLSFNRDTEAERVAAGYEQTVERFAAWVRDQEDVRAALVIGSRAVKDRPVDCWADLDFLVMADGAAEFCQDDTWRAEIGDCALSFVDTSPAGMPERRILFADGLEVDVLAVPTETARRAVVSGEGVEFASVLGRGVRVILDRDGLVPRLMAAVAKLPPLPAPTESEFLNTVHGFWYHAVWTARHLRRGELWRAKSKCDGHMKELLRAVMEWHARAARGPGCDTWFGGMFLEQWADVRAVRELGDAFARYDEDDVWRALFATMGLFGWLARETAQQLGLSYPETGEAVAFEGVRRLNVGRNR